MGSVKKLNDTHLRITCSCGEFYHEIRKAEDGGIEYEEFAKAKPKTQKEDEGEAPAKPKPKKFGFFD